MGSHTAAEKPSDPSAQSESESVPWIQGLSRIIGATNQDSESRMRTTISCNVKDGRTCLFVPPDMASLQPASLRYIHTFARRHQFTLVEDRRRVEIQPIVENRDQQPPMIALGLSMLLKQTGVPGSARTLSKPHRLNADSPHIGLSKLVNMAAYANHQCKRVVLLPNRMIVDVLDNDTQPIAAYACKLISADTTTVLSHFDSPTFRAIGYSTGSQYVMHLMLAGGPLRAPQMWTQLHTMTRTDFRFQLFRSKQMAHDFGLFYTTFYLDLTEKPVPWWLNPDSESTGFSKKFDADTFRQHGVG